MLVWNWRRAIGRVRVVAGLLLAVATDIRRWIVQAAVYLVAAVRPWRRLAVRASLLLGRLLLPVLGYLGGSRRRGATEVRQL